jgi:hypothetical protein
MRVWPYLGIAVCLAGIGAVLYGALPSSRDAKIVQSANPQDVKVIDGVFVSDYFNLSYRLPDGWTEGLAGPPPSQSGYYVLGTWAPKRDFAGTILVVAQDVFFAPDPSDDVKNAVAEFRQVMSAVDGMTIDREPAPRGRASWLPHRFQRRRAFSLDVRDRDPLPRRDIQSDQPGSRIAGKPGAFTGRSRFGSERRDV